MENKMAQNDLISYNVSVPSIDKHQFQVKFSYPTRSARASATARLIPGSYMIRDFAKNILWLKVFSQEGKKPWQNG